MHAQQIDRRPIRVPLGRRLSVCMIVVLALEGCAGRTFELNSRLHEDVVADPWRAEFDPDSRMHGPPSGIAASPRGQERASLAQGAGATSAQSHFRPPDAHRCVNEERAGNRFSKGFDSTWDRLREKLRQPGNPSFETPLTESHPSGAVVEDVWWAAEQAAGDDDSQDSFIEIERLSGAPDRTLDSTRVSDSQGVSVAGKEAPPEGLLTRVAAQSEMSPPNARTPVWEALSVSIGRQAENSGPVRYVRRPLNQLTHVANERVRHPDTTNVDQDHGLPKSGRPQIPISAAHATSDRVGKPISAEIEQLTPADEDVGLTAFSAANDNRQARLADNREVTPGAEPRTDGGVLLLPPTAESYFSFESDAEMRRQTSTVRTDDLHGRIATTAAGRTRVMPSPPQERSPLAAPTVLMAMNDRASAPIRVPDAPPILVEMDGVAMDGADAGAIGPVPKPRPPSAAATGGRFGLLRGSGSAWFVFGLLLLLIGLRLISGRKSKAE